MQKATMVVLKPRDVEVWKTSFLYLERFSNLRTTERRIRCGPLMEEERPGSAFRQARWGENSGAEDVIALDSYPRRVESFSCPSGHAMGSFKG